MKGKLFKINQAGFDYMCDFTDRYQDSEREPITEGTVVISLEDDSCPFVIDVEVFNSLSMTVDEVFLNKYKLNAWALTTEEYLIEV